MSTAPMVPDPADVAWWVRELRTPQGCLRPVPDRTDPRAVAAYAEALLQLAAEARTEVGAEPEAAP